MPSSEYQRPDPDTLLAQMQAQERRASRGKLRIYFGASAGVGKTYAMLNAARSMQAEKRDVVVGLVETHGRKETAAFLDGLEVLPRKEIAYRDKTIAEFDIDAALARKPALILVDELAHSNAPGSRHPKRWQDVEELLGAGIDVFTAVNVQHLESLNDVIGGITGIRVAETLPDTVFDQADEIVLVDIPADDLLARLKEGKVYQPQQAERASRNFFRKGNLIALRELALRRTADRIEDDVQAYRIEKSINAVWKTDSDLLACIGPRTGAEHVIRSTAQLASQLNAQWHAVYVETPQLQRLASSERERILKTLKLAQDLGATTAVLPGSDIAHEIVSYARSHNFSRITLGRNHNRWPWRKAHAQRIATYAPDIDLIETGERQERASVAGKTPAKAVAQDDEAVASGKSAYLPYVWTVAICILTALVTTPMMQHLDLANIVMLFLLAEVLIAVRFGRGPAVLAAFLSVAVFDFFFVSPRFSFAVSDVQYLVTFSVLLVVGLIVGQLTSGLRFQARIAAQREGRARALYEFARELSSALQAEQVFETTQNFIQRTFRARAILLLPNDEAKLQTTQSNEIDPGIAQWAFDRATPAGMGTDTLPASAYFYLPLVAPMRTRGVLAIKPDNRRWMLVPEQRRQLDTFAALAAIALERVHYIEVAQDALLRMESERLRNSLLAAISHDLRTPLTALVGLSESLTLSKPELGKAQQELAHALHDEALRMGNLVTNLLDMARIQSGEVKLNLQWQQFEEVVGSALRAVQSLLGKHQVVTRLASDLPLVNFDAVLIERVLCNLLENASKYTPPGSQITIAAETSGQYLSVMVYDNGPGLPAGQEETIFEKFTRGERESATPGVGLGLAICRAIIEAHHGTIRGGHAPQGGAAIIFTLPLGTPPAMPDMEEGDITNQTP
ncbi:two-component system sensor histidine kinase KdbD [Herminiimonas sp. KBW02]|uniref:two-component system sensor histidine kinase KdpD n=1 Tax=Herminiimonas sp. KBW02 TaxID=2153363 RepID=UPI000F58FEA3|nr:two-component system sensor histidine kinase KdpD [Herminiimonas sp. KBW02]RQO36591.1 two-component system sensor histidine kinase KdbD [Herminiimonas sp. KBW02]